MKTLLNGLFLAGTILLAGGCAEPKTVYVPIYPAPTTYAGQPTVIVPGQFAYAPALASLQAATNANTPPVVLLESRNEAPVAPPPPQIETISGVPSVDYAWQPGHWAWNGAWFWVSGQWTLKPYPTAKWEPGRWEKHGRNYYWAEGRWW
jgi:hypothetical protein